MELRRARPDPGRISADLVGSQEPAVAVVRGVLDALRHHGSRQLLEAAGHLVPGVGHPWKHRVERGIEIGTACTRGRDGCGQVVRTEREVGAVDAEGHREFGQRRRHDGILRRRRAEQPGDASDLGLQDGRGDVPLTGLDVIGEVEFVAGELPVQRGQGILGRVVDEDLVDLGHRVVAGGPLDRPVGQQLTGLQDLLDQQPSVRRQGVEPVQIAAGIGEPVRMVDAEPVDAVVLDPASNAAVDRVEHLRVLDPYPGQ